MLKSYPGDIPNDWGTSYYRDLGRIIPFTRTLVLFSPLGFPPMWSVFLNRGSNYENETTSSHQVSPFFECNMRFFSTKCAARLIYNSWMFILRPAEKNDSTIIKNMVREARLNPTGLDWRRFMVAVSDDGEIVGCGQVKPHRDGIQEIASLVTAKHWRNRGIGSALIEYFQQTHMNTLYLMCLASLGSFYERFGFIRLSVEQMPHFYQRIKRLMKVMEVMRSDGEFLLVMRWDPVESGSLHTPPRL